MRAATAFRWAAPFALLASLAHAAPAVLVSHTPGSATNTGDGGLGSGFIPFDEFAIIVPLRFYAMARDSGDVAFTSAATNLVTGEVDVEGADLDVYHWERATGTIRLVSHASFSTTTTCSGGIATVFPGGISADGRFVVFQSDCSDLDPALPGADSAFLWDRDTEAVTLLSWCNISLGVDTALPGYYPTISESGAIYYTGDAAGAVSFPYFCPGGALGIPAGIIDAGFTRTLVTHVAGSPGVASAGTMDPRNRAFSADGTFLVYSSTADDLVAGQVASAPENLFLYDVVANTSQLVTHATGSPATPATVGSGGNFELNPNAAGIAFAADGSTVAYSSRASDLIAGFIDANGAADADLYVYDRVAGTNLLASHRFDNLLQGGDDVSANPALNDDGTRLAYASSATDLVAGQISTPGARSVFLWESATGASRMVSHAAASTVTEGGGFSIKPAIDATGDHVAYASTGNAMIAGLVDADDPGFDVFLWTLTSDTTVLASRNAVSATTTDSGSDLSLTPDFPLIDATGSLVVFPTEGTDLVAGQADSNADADLFIFTPALPTVSFVTGASAVTEAAATSITIQLSALSGVDVTVPFTLGGSASNGGDFTATPTPATITAGTLSTTIDVTAINDVLDENPETVVFTLGAPVNATLLAPTVHTLTINDNDPPPTVRFGLGASGVNEGLATTITVQLSAPSSFNVSVPFSVGGTAGRPADFGIGASPLTIPAGQTSITIPVSTVNDTLDESGETVVVTLGAPTNAVLGAPSTHTLTINDDDLPPRVQFAAATGSVGEGITTSIALQLTEPSGFNISVPFSAGGSATSPSDYSIASANPVVIPAGSTAALIQVAIVADGALEGDETVVLSLGAPTNASLGVTSAHTLTIVESDPPQSVSLVEAQGAVSEGGSIVITLQLSAPVGQPVTVPFSISGSALAGSDYTSPASPVVIPAGVTSATITLATVDDGIAEHAEDLVLTLGTPTNATLGTPAAFTLSIADDEPVPVATFALDTLSLREGEGVDLRVDLSGPAANDVSVPFTLGGDAAPRADYQVAASPLVIPAGTTSAILRLDTTADGAPELAESLSITLGASAMAKASNTLVITILDSSPTVNFVTTQTTLTEGFSTEIIVALDAPLAEDAVIEFSVSPVHDEPGATPDDYILQGSPIVIPAGETQGVIHFQARRDPQIEVEECMLLHLQLSVNASPGPRRDSLIVIRSEGGVADEGGAFTGWLVLLALLARRRTRGAIVLIAASLATATTTAHAEIAPPDDTQPYLVRPPNRDWWTPEEYVAIALGSGPDVLTGQFLLELDAIDVTPMTRRSEHGYVMVMRPPKPLKPGMHRLRLVRHETGGQLIELAVWDFELRASEGFRAAGLANAISVQGGALALSSEDIDPERDYNGNGSLRMDVKADTGLGDIKAHANLLTDSNSLRTGTDKVKLGDFAVAGGDQDMRLVAGNHAVTPVGGQTQRDFIYDGGSRRGMSLSAKLPLAAATVTAYSYGSEPASGFHRGFGFSRAGERFTGSHVQAVPFRSETGQVGLSLGYLQGAGRRGGTSIYSAEDGLIYETRGVDGRMGDAVLDTRWFSGALSLRAEYARSERNFPLILGEEIPPVTDDAMSYVLAWQPQQGWKIGEHELTWRLTLDRQEIGTAFRSIAAPGGAIDITQNRAAAGLQFRSVTLDLSAAHSEDNVAGAPFPTTGVTNFGAQASYAPEFDEGTLPSFLQAPNLSLGIGTDRRETVRMPEEDAGAPIDTDSRNLTAAVAFTQPLGGWSVSYTHGAADDGTLQSPGTRNMTAALDANFQFGERVNLTTQVFMDLSRQLALQSLPDAEFEVFLPAASTRTHSGTLGLQWQVIPQRWNMTLGYAISRARTGDRTLETRSQQVDFNSTWNVWKFNLFLRGSYQHAFERTLFLPYEDETGEPSPPEFAVSRRESYQALAGLSFNFRLE